MAIMWQGNSEKKWRLGERLLHKEADHYEQQLDFVWLADDDIRRVGNSSHYDKISIYGSAAEVDRLGPLLVGFLNENRAAGELTRPTNADIRGI